MKQSKKDWYLSCLQASKAAAINGEKLAAEISPEALANAKAITAAYDKAIEALL